MVPSFDEKRNFVEMNTACLSETSHILGGESFKRRHFVFFVTSQGCVVSDSKKETV